MFVDVYVTYMSTQSFTDPKYSSAAFLKYITVIRGGEKIGMHVCVCGRVCVNMYKRCVHVVVSQCARV